MSDTIYKWARRTVEGLTLNGEPLDLEHLAALAEAVTEMVHEQLPGKVYSETTGGRRLDAALKRYPPTKDAQHQIDILTGKRMSDPD